MFLQGSNMILEKEKIFNLQLDSTVAGAYCSPAVATLTTWTIYFTHFTIKQQLVFYLVQPAITVWSWKGRLSYELCLGQKKSRNAIEPHCVRDVKEDYMCRRCGEFRAAWPGTEMVRPVMCVFVGSAVTHMWFSSNFHYVQSNCWINQVNVAHTHRPESKTWDGNTEQGYWMWSVTSAPRQDQCMNRSFSAH